jgi:CHASE1-domain containing sensor protein
MARARRLGIPALSGKVRLAQETSTDVQPGVLLYLPVFRENLPPRRTPSGSVPSAAGYIAPSA